MTQLMRRLQRRLLGPAQQDLRALRLRVQVLLTVFLVATNVSGAAIVLALNLLIIPGGGPSRELWIALSIAAPSYVAVAVTVGTTMITVVTVRELRWALAGQTPTRRQRHTALRLPWRITRVVFALWLLGAVVFTTLALAVQPEAALPTAAGVVIAGMVTGAIGHLLSEYTLRPVAARALADQGDERIVVSGVRRRMLFFWMVGSGAPSLGLVVGGIVVLTQPDDITLTRFAWAVITLAVVVMAFGLFVTTLNTESFVAPITAVREGIARVRAGDLSARVDVDATTELGLLQAGFNDMAEGLEERERIRDLFGRHVGESVAEVATRAEPSLGGRTLEASVLMIDLIGSTGYAADRAAAEVVETLNRFFAVVVEEVERHDGLVNKFMGDAVLAIFGAPRPLDDPDGAALGAARAIASRLTAEVPDIGAGIGVASGEVVAGNVGAASRFEYTVIGDAVNAAARLTELAKHVPGHVLVAQRCVDAAAEEERAHWTPHGEQVLRGRPTPTRLAVLAAPTPAGSRAPGGD